MQLSISLAAPTFGEEEIAAAVEVLRSTMVTSSVKVRAMEDLFGPNAVMCNSGSSANLLAIAALCNPLCKGGLRPGDEVIVSALSWSTTIWPLVQHGLVPVIVDIDPLTLNIDMEQVRAAVGPRTRAVMPVHVYGNPCDFGGLPSDLILIEDCCEALGAPVGHSGAFATYSFYFSHHITTLEGGMVVARDPEHAELMRMLRAHGWTRDMRNPEVFNAEHPEIDPRFLFVNAGYNLRATELQAAIGLIQMRKLKGFVAHRRQIAGELRRALEFCPWLRPQHGNGSSWFGFPVTVTADAPFRAKELRARFAEHGIETRPLICGNIARQPGMRLWPHRVHGDLRHADHAMREGFALPCHHGVTRADVERIAAVFASFR